MASAFDLFIDKVKDFFNQPIPIIGCSIGFLLVFVLVIFSKTSFGKRWILKLKALIEELKESFRALKKYVEESIATIKSYSETEIKKIEGQYSELSSLIVVIAENSHNIKVKEALLVYKEKADKCKNDFEGYIEDKIAAANDEKYKSEIEYLKSRIEELVEKVEKSPLNSELDVNYEEGVTEHVEESEEK